METDRLVLRRPLPADAEAIFARYSSDAEVTRFLGWPRHTAARDASEFIQFSDLEWQRWSAGPYLIESRETGALLGGTGLSLETPYRASTGYVLAKDSWGRGYATEALRAMIAVASNTPIYRLHALCHPEHLPSQRVLEKCGFVREALLRRYAELPNHRFREPADVLCYIRLIKD